MENQEVEKQEIKLTEKQISIIQNIFNIKGTLEAEYKKILERESEFIINLCEAKDIVATQGIEFKDGVMYVPKQAPAEPTQKLKKLK